MNTVIPAKFSDRLRQYMLEQPHLRGYVLQDADLEAPPSVPLSTMLVAVREHGNRDDLAFAAGLLHGPVMPSLLEKVRGYVMGQEHLAPHIEQMGDASHFMDVIEAHGNAQDRAAINVICAGNDVVEVGSDVYGEQVAREKAQSERKANIEQATLDFRHDGQLVEPRLPARMGPWERRKGAITSHTAAREWVDGTGPPILVIGGGFGNGKTHLGISAAHLLAEVGEPVAWRTEPELLAEIRDARDAGSTQEAKRHDFCRIPHLVIDDFGMASLTPWGDEQMDVLINERWQGALEGVLRTMLTANMLPEQLPARIADRLSDRRYARTVTNTATSYRRSGG